MYSACVADLMGFSKADFTIPLQVNCSAPNFAVFISSYDLAANTKAKKRRLHNVHAPATRDMCWNSVALYWS